jgi:hypothetical protein
MGDKTTAVLNAVSQAVYDVRQSCIASAIAVQTVAATDDKSVTIDGLDMTNTASTQVDSCTQTSSVDMQSIYGNMDTLLNQVVKAASGMEGAKRTFIATLKSVITVSVVDTCTALAISATKVLVQHAKSVTFDNVRLGNIATATIQKCLQTVDIVVGGQPTTLETYIKQNESWMAGVSGSEPSSSSNGNPLANALASQRVFPSCDALQQETRYTWFATGIVGLFGVAAAVVL